MRVAVVIALVLSAGIEAAAQQRPRDSTRRPRPISSFSWRGVWRRRATRPARSQALKRAIALDPKSAELHAELGRLLCAAEQRRPKPWRRPTRADARCRTTSRRIACSAWSSRRGATAARRLAGAHAGAAAGERDRAPHEDSRDAVGRHRSESAAHAGAPASARRQRRARGARSSRTSSRRRRLRPSRTRCSPRRAWRSAASMPPSKPWRPPRS